MILDISITIPLLLPSRAAASFAGFHGLLSVFGVLPLFCSFFLPGSYEKIAFCPSICWTASSCTYQRYRRVGFLLDHTYTDICSHRNEQTLEHKLYPFTSSGSFRQLWDYRPIFQELDCIHGVSKNTSVLDEERWELSGTMARTEPCILGFYLSHKGGCNRRDNSSPSV